MAKFFVQIGVSEWEERERFRKEVDRILEKLNGHGRPREDVVRIAWEIMKGEIERRDRDKLWYLQYEDSEEEGQ